MVCEFRVSKKSSYPCSSVLTSTTSYTVHVVTKLLV